MVGVSGDGDEENEGATGWEVAKVESENERGGGVGGEGLDGEVYRVKELIVARGKVEVVKEEGRVCVGARVCLCAKRWE